MTRKEWKEVIKTAYDAARNDDRCFDSELSTVIKL